VVGKAVDDATERLAGGTHVVDDPDFHDAGSPIRSMIVLRNVSSWKLLFVR
jgi:hypothetical protein